MATIAGNVKNQKEQAGKAEKAVEAVSQQDTVRELLISMLTGDKPAVLPMGAAVEYGGEKIMLPPEMGLKTAIETLQRQLKYEDEIVEIAEQIPGNYYDGAHAFYQAMVKEFGWVFGEPIPPTFFTPEQKPQMISIPSGVDTHVLVPLGRFGVPGVKGYIETTHSMDEHQRAVFTVVGQVQRKAEARIRKLADLAREIIKTNSLYKGKAVRVRFKGDDGKNLVVVQPKFMDVRGLSKDSLILSDPVNDAVNSSVFTPIEHSDTCRKYGIPLKRGIMFEGPFGTGKTLAAYVTAKLCEQNGWTFVYNERADELSEAVRLAHAYQPAVIFNEDVDRITKGERDIDMDALLNIIDGIESKNTEIMVVLTTNDIEQVNRAMLRPGRLDDVIYFSPPDAKAVERLLRYYGTGLIADGEDLREVGQVLEGQIASVVREVVERSKLSAIKLGARDKLVIRKDALLDAARSMKRQMDLLAGKKDDRTTDEFIGRKVRNAVGTTLFTGPLRAVTESQG